MLNTMVCGPGVGTALRSTIACRKLPPEASVVLLTVKVAAWVAATVTIKVRVELAIARKSFIYVACSR